MPQGAGGRWEGRALQAGSALAQVEGSGLNTPLRLSSCTPPGHGFQGQGAGRARGAMN